MDLGVGASNGEEICLHGKWIWLRNFQVVNRTSLIENRRDVRVWSFDNSNSFSVSNFYLQATHAQNEETLIGTQGQLAWRNVAPPKAQL